MPDNKEALSPKQKKILKRFFAKRRILKRFKGRSSEEIKQLKGNEWGIFDFNS
jgi:hypothetical protein